MTVYLIPNPTKHEAFRVARQAVDILHKDGVDVVADESCREKLTGCEGIRFLPAGEGYAASDVVLTVGGDGTILHTARHVAPLDKPLLGINIGRLGFLAIIEANELNKLHRIARGEYSVEYRGVLQATCTGNGADEDFALNDVVLFKQRPEKTIELDIYCDDILVSSFRGDGVVFATPTGSTAYSLSAGGPVLDARLGGIVVTHICAHIIHSPPMVFATDRVLRAVPRGRERVYISCDGLQSREVALEETIEIRQSNLRVPLVQFADAAQLKSIDKKLKGR